MPSPGSLGEKNNELCVKALSLAKNVGYTDAAWCSEKNNNCKGLVGKPKIEINNKRRRSLWICLSSYTLSSEFQLQTHLSL